MHKFVIYHWIGSPARQPVHNVKITVGMLVQFCWSCVVTDLCTDRELCTMHSFALLFLFC